MTANEKSPRQHAADLLSLKPEDRPAALEQIPAEHRAAVAQYLEAYEIKRNGQIAHYAKLIMKLSFKAERRAALTGVPEDIRQDVEALVVESFASRSD